MDLESLKKLSEEYQFKYDKHLTPELDMTSLVLKAHLFLEEILYEIVLLHCKVPKALEGIQFSFHHKLKLAEALYQSPLGRQKLTETLKEKRERLFSGKPVCKQRCMHKVHGFACRMQN